MKLTQKNFNKILEDNYTFENYPIVSVAVSGGPDSMCLLFLLKRWCKKINGKLTYTSAIGRKKSIKKKYSSNITMSIIDYIL